MSASVHGVTDIGTEAVLIDIECHLSNSLPNIVIVGFANKAVDEAKERLRGAFTNSHLQIPRKRITINLAPADIPKDSTGFDLAMATAIMMAAGYVEHQPSTDEIYIGELGLDGSVRPVRGIIGKLLGGRNKGMKTFYVPEANKKQAMLVPGIKVIPVANLHDLYLDHSNTKKLEVIETKNGLKVDGTESLGNKYNDFDEIIGQAQAKRAMEIVAAGGHNILLNGPPGTGKSMLAKALPSILPPLTHEEILEVTHLHSLASKSYDHIVTERPFRSPHHSASDIAIIGGGQNPRPGEISLSHRGVLFFDEFPEFSRPSMEALRQPLEDKTITVSRAKDSISYPANFVLVATANPCPCGYYGTKKTCQCLPHQIYRYQRKISGPIMDRIDLSVAVEEVEHERLLKTPSHSNNSSSDIIKRILKARAVQNLRYANEEKLNSDMTNHDIKRSAKLSDEAVEMLNKAAKQLNISARSYMRTIKVARTIADLEGSERIEVPHITEALQYRKPQYQYQA